MFHRGLCACTWLAAAFGMTATSAAGAEPQSELPPPAARRVDFATDVQPILARTSYHMSRPEEAE
jgi:hypothetical protein